MICALAASCLPGVQFASAQAVGDYRSRAPGYWDQLTTWDRFNGSAWVNQNPGGSVPNASSFVVIQSQFPVTIRSTAPYQYADHLQVDGNLSINSGCTLELGQSGNATTTIASFKWISVEGTLRFVNTQILRGQGRIVLVNGVIDILRPSLANRNHSLTSHLTIEGHGLLHGGGTGPGTATFVNSRTSIGLEGRVLATAAGKLQIASSLLLEDKELVDGSGHYRPEFASIHENGQSTLQFDSGNLHMVSNFILMNCSTFVFNASIASSGDLIGGSPFSGTIVVASDQTFEAANISPMTAGTYVSDDCE